jgi:hypothetical protein
MRAGGNERGRKSNNGKSMGLLQKSFGMKRAD